MQEQFAEEIKLFEDLYKLHEIFKFVDMEFSFEKVR
jgi:hypothetical protein